MLKSLGTISSKLIKNWIPPVSGILSKSSNFSTWKLITPVVSQLHINMQPSCSTQNSSARSLLAVNNLNANPTRNVTNYSLKTGKKKSVNAVLARFFRLHNGLWIRRRAGCHKRLHKRNHRDKYNLTQHVVCTKTQCLMLDRMITNYWKKPKYFLDDPFEPYHKRNNFDYVYPYRPLK
ncbi:39S ribosomal protein L35, mitochondrial-like isoform X2 [Argiope bruennichi]|uniref:39S ribosomal protein L35, mitochondrial-like isoform X2 n=1 Tax=Argiope bruennichi TaxID=94029 RepID=UPI002494C3FA|nr:39S ribosomal protein L35, mitochondrial-like isoform X2 [Argiope bruennichi]